MIAGNLINRFQRNLMKKILFIFFTVLSLAQFTNAQETYFQTGHTHDILEVHFSPDDAQLVSYSAGDGRFILWDVKSGRQIWTRKTSFIRKANENTNLKGFYWSTDGKTLVTKSANGTYQTWDALTGNILALAETKPEIELITPSKKEISYTKDYSKITVSENGETKEFKRFGNNSALDTSNNGEMVAEGAGWGDASIKITEIKTGKSWFLDGHPSMVGGIAFSPDGNSLAVGGSDKFIYVFETATKSVVKKLNGNGKPLKSISFSPNGEYLFALNNDGEMNVWHLPDEKLLRSAEAMRGIFRTISNEFSKDGKYFLFVNEGDFAVWQTSDLKQLSGFKTAEKYESEGGIGYDRVPVFSAAFINEGKEILASHYDGTWRVWDVNSGKQIKKFSINEDAKFLVNLGNQKVIAVVHGKDRNNDEMKIKIFNTENGVKEKQFDGERTNFIEAIVLSPNGKNFITSDIGGDVLLWSIDKSKPIREFEIGFSGDDSIAFSPDGKTFAVGGRNQNLFLFNVETGEKLWQLIPSYQPGELEMKLTEEKDKRQAVLNDAKNKLDAQAAIDTEKYKKQIFITFDHYGDASDAGEKRMVESSEAKESKTIKSRENANAVWLRLRNDSPLPVEIPTQSMYPPNGKCFFEFSDKLKINGLCDGAEISVWHGLKDKNGKWIPFGFDFGSSAILLPKTSVLFSVPLKILKDGNRMAFSFTFQNIIDAQKIDDYGTAKELSFGEKDLPK